MKSIVMKGKNVDEAIKAAVQVLGVERDKVKTRVINEGKAGMMGIIGGEEAEVEVEVAGSKEDEAREIVQAILDKMQFLAIAEASSGPDGTINIRIKGEDMGRIIGKEGNMLMALEAIVKNILWKKFGERVMISLDAGDYKQKRISALERLANDVANEVRETGKEKSMPGLSPADRRTIHMYLKEQAGIETYSIGDGRDRTLRIAPKNQ